MSKYVRYPSLTWQPPVATVGNLPTDASPGDARVVLASDSIYIYGNDLNWHLVGTGSGAVDSVNGQTGVVVLDADDIAPTGTRGYVPVSALVADTVIMANSTATDIESSPTLSYSELDGLRSNVQYLPSGLNETKIQTVNQLSIDPSIASPDSAAIVTQNSVQVDPNSTGFSIGSNGRLLTATDNNINHTGTANIGEVVFTSNYLNIGNGTDPLSIRGISYSYGFGNINDGVDVVGPIQGYGFQPTFAATATVDTNTYINAFYDFFNAPGTAVSSYSSFSAGPNLSEVRNNSSYNGININPTIDTFSGNAGTTGLSIAGVYGTFDTGSFTGINVNPTITEVDYAVGLYVDVSNVTLSMGGSKRAADFNGDVNINGNLAFTGGLSIGQINAFASLPLVDGGGVPTSGQSLITNPTAAANATIANADFLGVNTAMLMQIGDNATITTSFLGVTALGLPAVVGLGTGATVDRVGGAVFAISLDATATGGTIDTVALCRALALPNGITTVNRLYGYEFDLPFGDPGTDTWAFYSTQDVPSWMQGSLLIGGSAGGGNDRPTNTSVGVEIASTTKAFLNARMTTTERNALTAVNGMQIYNTTTDKLQVYAAGSWVDLH